MKTTYFTPDTITEKTADFLNRLEAENLLRPLPEDFSRTALLVLDMQDYFLAPEAHAFIPGAPAIIPRINQLIERCRTTGRPIILTRHINTAADAGQMKFWWRDLITVENPLSRIYGQLATGSNPVITKPQYDAFQQTELNQLLQRNGIKTVIITGVLTHLCCETTARSAFVNGYRVVFPADGSATYNEKFHVGTLRNLAHGFANVTSIDQLLDLL